MEQVSVLETNIGSSTTGNSANTQIIFNDNGTLRGDTGLVFNKTTDALTVAGLVTAGSATITGAATVGTTLGVTGVSTFAAGTAALPALTTTGDTNTGIYYPAADTFAVTTGGTQRILVNSTGLNVGAGVQYARITSTGNNATGIANIENSPFASNANSNLSCYIGHDATNNRPFIQAATGNSGSAFSLLINPYGGDVSIGNGNVVMATSGKGIDFSAVTGGTGTATANVLNDYEEGTFVANIAGTTPTYTSRIGRYTKIGNRVLFTIRLTINNAGDGSDSVISGLPFANNSTAPCPIVVGYFANLKTNAAFLAGFVDQSVSHLIMTGTTGSVGTITNGFGVIGNGTDLSISGQYFVA
jgi:hypothetical protein